MSRARLVTAAGLLVGLAVGAAAHVRLMNPANAWPLWWGDPQVSVVVNDAGSDDLAPGEHLPALTSAIEAWSGVEGTTAGLVEDTSEAQRARTDWGAADIHLMMFDEDNSSGYFPTGSSTVAITPVWFTASGVILDADVLFNGKGYRFTTSGYPGRFDVQDVAAHELGHLLGFDHSGWAGATMYPYVDPTVVLHRSISEDERCALRSVYPSGAPAGSISGRVVREGSGTPVAGAHVVARDASGRTAASVLADGLGGYRIAALAPGDYTVYARPLDQPVGSFNLTAGWVVDTDFEPAAYPAALSVTDGADLPAGDLTVGADVALNLGKSVDKYPLRLVSGRAQVVTVRGTGLVPGSTLTVSDPSLTVAPLGWLGTLVQARIGVPSRTEPGHVDLVVTNPDGDVSVLTAGLEITPPAPQVTAVAPTRADAGGGTLVTVTGLRFEPGCRVVIGDRVYVDGLPGGCTYVDPGRIDLTLGETLPGEHDVVVMDTTGVEGRLIDAFTTTEQPLLESVFPPSGALAGGTTVALRGQELAPDAEVRIGGVLQPAVTWEDETLLRVTTAAGVAPGPQVLEVTNPGGTTAQLAFVYVNQPDPDLDQLEPIAGPAGGGTTITVEGENFTPDTTLWFGVDPLTGEGGVEAPNVVYVDDETLAVLTPSHPGGTVAVRAEEGGTGQVSVLTAGFTFEAPPGGGGGGGGCGTVVVSGPPGPADALAGGAWIAALLLLLLPGRLRAGRRLAAAA
jgi:hypothetical protein